MRQISVLATATAILAGTLLSLSSTPANADGGYEIWGLNGTDRVVKSGSCRTVHITARTNIPSDYSPRADVELWLRGQYVESVSLSSAGSGRLRGSFYHCPNLDGVGEFKLGPSEVSYYDDDFNDYTFNDASRGAFNAKQAARFTKLKATRKGSTLTVKANPQYYSSGYGWSEASRKYSAKSDQNKSMFKLQRRASNGSGSWTNIKGAKPPKGKTITFKVKAKKKFQYRIVSTGTKRTFKAHTKAFRR